MYMFNSHLSHYINLYIDVKRKLGFKFEAQVGTFKMIDKALIERGETGPGISREFAEFWYTKRPHESDRTRYGRSLLLREFCGFLASSGVITYCPRTPKPPRSNFIPYIFSHKQVEDILEASNTLSYKYRRSEASIQCIPALLRLLYATGIRIGEALSLKDEDINLIDKTLIIKDSKNGTQRIVPFTDSLSKSLIQYREFRDKTLTGFNHPKFFFCTFTGDKVGKTFVETIFHICHRKAGIPYLGQFKGPRLHDLRHTFACHSLAQMCDKGMDVYVALPILSTYLGHKNLDATNGYVRLTSEVFPQVIEKIDLTCLNVFPSFRTYNNEND